MACNFCLGSTSSQFCFRHWLLSGLHSTVLCDKQVRTVSFGYTSGLHCALRQIAELLGDAYIQQQPIPSIKTRALNPLAKSTVPTTMESQLANGSYLWIPSVIPSSPAENVPSNVPSYVLSRPAGIPAESLSASHIIPTRLRNPIHRWSLRTT